MTAVDSNSYVRRTGSVSPHRDRISPMRLRPDERFPPHGYNSQYFVVEERAARRYPSPTPTPRFSAPVPQATAAGPLRGASRGASPLPSQQHPQDAFQSRVWANPPPPPTTQELRAGIGHRLPPQGRLGSTEAALELLRDSDDVPPSANLCLVAAVHEARGLPAWVGAAHSTRVVLRYGCYEGTTADACGNLRPRWGEQFEFPVTSESWRNTPLEVSLRHVESGRTLGEVTLAASFLASRPRSGEQEALQLITPTTSSLPLSTRGASPQRSLPNGPILRLTWRLALADAYVPSKAASPSKAVSPDHAKASSATALLARAPLWPPTAATEFLGEELAVTIHVRALSISDDDVRPKALRPSLATPNDAATVSGPAVTCGVAHPTSSAAGAWYWAEGLTLVTRSRYVAVEVQNCDSPAAVFSIGGFTLDLSKLPKDGEGSFSIVAGSEAYATPFPASGEFGDNAGGTAAADLSPAIGHALIEWSVESVASVVGHADGHTLVVTCLQGQGFLHASGKPLHLPCVRVAAGPLEAQTPPARPTARGQCAFGQELRFVNYVLGTTLEVGVVETMGAPSGGADEAAAAVADVPIGSDHGSIVVLLQDPHMRTTACLGQLLLQWTVERGAPSPQPAQRRAPSDTVVTLTNNGGSPARSLMEQRQEGVEPPPPPLKVVATHPSDPEAPSTAPPDPSSHGATPPLRPSKEGGQQANRPAEPSATLEKVSQNTAATALPAESPAIAAEPPAAHATGSPSKPEPRQPLLVPVVRVEASHDDGPKLSARPVAEAKPVDKFQQLSVTLPISSSEDAVSLEQPSPLMPLPPATPSAPKLTKELDLLSPSSPARTTATAADAISDGARDSPVLRPLDAATASPPQRHFPAVPRDPSVPAGAAVDRPRCVSLASQLAALREPETTESGVLANPRLDGLSVEADTQTLPSRTDTASVATGATLDVSTAGRNAASDSHLGAYFSRAQQEGASPVQLVETPLPRASDYDSPPLSVDFPAGVSATDIESAAPHDRAAEAAAVPGAEPGTSSSAVVLTAATPAAKKAVLLRFVQPKKTELAAMEPAVQGPPRWNGAPADGTLYAGEPSRWQGRPVDGDVLADAAKEEAAAKALLQEQLAITVNAPAVGGKGCNILSPIEPRPWYPAGPLEVHVPPARRLRPRNAETACEVAMSLARSLQHQQHQQQSTSRSSSLSRIRGVAHLLFPASVSPLRRGTDPAPARKGPADRSGSATHLDPSYFLSSAAPLHSYRRTASARARSPGLEAIGNGGAAMPSPPLPLLGSVIPKKASLLRS